MMNTLNQIFRFILLVVLGAFGMAMALVFMVSTAIAIGVLYIAAKIKGRPFGARAYWSQRRYQRTPGSQTYRNARYRDADVIDVEAREIP